jgi:hypothetical protein
MYEGNLVPAVLRGRRLTHPHLYDRLVAAGLAPAYPRPAPPSETRAALAAVASVVVALAACAGLWQVASQAGWAVGDFMPALVGPSHEDEPDGEGRGPG